MLSRHEQACPSCFTVTLATVRRYGIAPEENFVSHMILETTWGHMVESDLEHVFIPHDSKIHPKLIL